LSCPLLCRLSTLASDAPSELDVLGHDRHTLGVDCTEVGVLEEADEVGLACLLQGHDGRALETQVGLEVLSDLTDETLEGKLANQQLCALLVTSDLTQGDSARPVSMRLLDAPGRRCALAGRLRRQLLPRGLPSRRLPCSLLRSGHLDKDVVSL
jgi:hypothetical protein